MARTSSSGKRIALPRALISTIWRLPVETRTEMSRLPSSMFRAIRPLLRMLA